MELKDIKGYEGLYAISDDGAVWSMTFRNNATQIAGMKKMMPFDNGHGYLVVSLSKSGRRKNHYIHRLVAEHFLPQKPSAKSVVNHKDYNRSNNAAWNLEWVTQKQNVRYSSHRMRHEKTRYKESNTSEKYITKYVKKDGSPSYRLYIRKFGVSKTFLSLEEAVRFRNGVISDAV